MLGARCKGLVVVFAVSLTALPACANRLTFEVRPDMQPDHVVACSVSLKDGWISLVQVQGYGMPAPQPTRWRMTRAEEAAIITAIQAFVTGDAISVDAYRSRSPEPPFVSVTWMTSLNGDFISGLYVQRGLHLPDVLSASLRSLGLDRTCGLTARADE